MTSQSYDSSQQNHPNNQMTSQTYDPSQQQQQQQQQQQYHYNYQNQSDQSGYYSYQSQYYPHPQHPSSYLYYQSYNSANQQVKDSSIYPPGVSIPDPNVSVSSNDQQNGYYYNYPDAGIGAAMHVQSDAHVQHHSNIQASNAVANETGHGSSSASVQGHFNTSHGQEHATPFTQGTAPVPVPASHLMQPSYRPSPSISSKHVKPKARKMKTQKVCQSARCELCNVDCNSLEIFEQHKNGKKHQKNLKNKAMVKGQTEIPSQFENREESNGKQLPLDNSSGVAVGSEVKTGEQNANITVGPAAKKRKKKSLEARKMNNGEGVKFVRSDDGSKRPVEPQKPEVVPLICELCNVKCESPVVFQAHLAGKKHLANLQRFQGEQAMLGQAAVQALYPALQVLYPALQALAQGDMSTLISELQQQGYLDPQGQPVPSNYFQGQGSEVPPAASTLSEIPPSSEIPQQQSDLPLDFVTTTEAKNDEQSGPVSTRDAESEILEDN